MRRLDLGLYESLLPEMAITEKYVGRTTFDWYYSRIIYLADLTIAVPFDLFDKVIVGILLVDEVLEIEEIGEILGMNIVHDPDRQRYRDDAEFEILKMALDSLVEYAMVSVGDIYYSSCRLTPLGREYAAKGKKFKTQIDERFALYFDHTSEQHATAHLLVKGLNGKAESIEDSEYFEDEAFVKELAAFQVPNIENVKTGDSFTNARVVANQSFTYQIALDIAAIYDLETYSIRFVATSPATLKALPEITDWLNLHRKQQLAQALCEKAGSSDEIVENQSLLSFWERLVAKGKTIMQMLRSDPEKATLMAVETRTKEAYVDLEYFWLHLDQFASAGEGDVYFVVPTELDGVELKILDWWKSNVHRTVFVLTTSTEMVNLLSEANPLFKHRIFVLKGRIEKAFCLWSAVDGGWTSYQTEMVGLPSKDLNVTFPMLKKVQFQAEGIRDWFSNIQRSFASTYLPKMVEVAKEESDRSKADPQVTKGKIAAYQKLVDAAGAFQDVQSEQGINNLFREIGKIRKELVETKLETLKTLLEAKITGLRMKVSALGEGEGAAIKALQKDVQHVIDEIPPELNEIQNVVLALQSDLEKVIHLEAQRLLAKTFIIDTNVLIDDPDFLSKIDLKDHIGLNLLVIEELDRLKTREATKEKATRAIRNLKKAFETGGKRIHKFKANLKLLPEELQTKSGDNYLLSIAMGCRGKNPVLITQDQNLHNKAQFLDIPVMSLKEFLGRHLASSQKSFAKEKPPKEAKQAKQPLQSIDYVGIFQKMPKDSMGAVVIHDFVAAVRKQHQSFQYQKHGFQKAYQFASSLQDFEIIENLYMKLKSK